MNSDAPYSECNAKAVAIAWKLQLRGYDSEETAVRALRRHCRGISAARAASVLRVAAAVLERAIRVLKPHLHTLAEIYHSRRELGPADLVQYEPELAAHFPGCPPGALKAALQSAMVYHLR